MLPLLQCRRRRTLKIDALAATASVGEEYAFLTEFLAFVAINPSTTWIRLEQGQCPTGTRVRNLGQEAWRRLCRYLLRPQSILTDLGGELLPYYRRYAICKAAKTLSIEPRRIIHLPHRNYTGEELLGLTKNINADDKCIRACGKDILGAHRDDIVDALTLKEHVSRTTLPVYLAVMASAYPARVKTECFSCITWAWAKSGEHRIRVLVENP